MTTSLLIVGNPLPFHVGAHLLAAARSLGIDAELADVRRAGGSRLIHSLSWRLCDRRPPWMRTFERGVLDACRGMRPQWLLVTGLAPLGRATLDAVGRLGVRRLNFLTDDPWNPSHRSRWFHSALPAYDVIFSPRRSNLSDLRSAGCPEVQYLPFGYNPDEHHPEPSPNEGRGGPPECDVLFVGGADRDRVPLVASPIAAGFRVALYGGYWDRYPETRAAARGQADLATLRRAVADAAVTLILVRRANRDGHVMRTFETAAGKSCMLVENTPEHRSLFGDEGECVAYFDDAPRMIAQVRSLLGDEALRRRLAAAAYQRVTADGRHTYADRLAQMLGL